MKTTGNTRAEHIRRNISDAQLQLKFKQMHLEEQDKTLYLYVTDEEIEFPNLTEVLTNPNYSSVLGQMELPFVVGFGIPDTIAMCDLSQFPHLLMGGSSGSGKTTGLQSLITSVVYNVPPSEVSLILIDTGATDLRCFKGLPHLACPVVREQKDVPRVLATLVAEAERRIELEYASQDRFHMLPRILLVIDEFPSLFLGLEKDMLKQVVSRISTLLQRGRHGKIHVVLSAQDPRRNEMKVDISNITAKIAFRCDRWQNSATILGTSGAETLAGKGELLLKAPQFDGIQRLQGVCASREELCQLIQEIKTRQYQPSECERKFTIAEDVLRTVGTGNCGVDMLTKIAPKPSVEDKIFADVILWALSQNSISVNRLQSSFHMGWTKASRVVEKLEELGVVERVDAKLARSVIPTVLDDIPAGMKAFLQQNGISENDVGRVFNARKT